MNTLAVIVLTMAYLAVGVYVTYLLTRKMVSDTGGSKKFDWGDPLFFFSVFFIGVFTVFWPVFLPVFPVIWIGKGVAKLYK